MRRSLKILIAVFSAVLLIAVSVHYIKGHSNVEPNSGQVMNTLWIEDHLRTWAPSHNKSLLFSSMFNRASYWHLEAQYNPLSVQLADLGMLYPTNATSVRIDLNYQPWLTNETKYQNETAYLVKNITDSGKSLIIADSASETYRSHPVTWSSFKSAWIERVTTIASEFHPQYYIVVKEPGWYYPMISDRYTNPNVYNVTQWVSLTEKLVNSVKSVSPATKVGVAIAAYDLYNGSQPKNGSLSFNVMYLRDVEKISNLNFIGFDIYGIPDFYGTMKFLDNYGAGGKQVWIPEAWSFPTPDNSSYATLDSMWVHLLYEFAVDINASEIMPFYSDLFASYNLSDNSPSSPSAIITLYQQRTPVFYAYRNLCVNYSV